jgi:hypothetical protein
MAQRVSREALRDYFALHNPSNVENVDVILSHFADDHAALVVGLRHKYGDTPKLTTPPVPSKDIEQSLERMESHDLVKSVEETADTSVAQKKASDPQPLVPATSFDYGKRSSASAPAASSPKQGCLSCRWLQCFSRKKTGKIALVDGAKEFSGDVTDEMIRQFALKYRLSVKKVALRKCTTITDAAIEALAALCPAIKTVNILACQNITDVSIKALATRCTTITGISIGSCARLTDDALVSLATNCNGIEKIVLSGCKLITSLGVEALAVHCTGLKWVIMQGCPLVTNSAIDALATHCSHLQSVNISGCRLVTDR